MTIANKCEAITGKNKVQDVSDKGKPAVMWGRKVTDP